MKAAAIAILLALTPVGGVAFVALGADERSAATAPAASRPADPVAAARLSLEREKPQEAIAQLLPMAQRNPKSAEVCRLLAEAYRRLQQPAEARLWCQQALDIEPTADGCYLLGLIHLDENMPALAAEQFQRALKLGRTGGDAHYALAQAFERLDQDFGRVRVISAPGATAGRIVDGAYLIEPVDGDPDLFRAAPPESAIYQLREALDDGVDSWEARRLLARLWLKTRRFAAAAAAFAEAESDVPRGARAGYCREFAEALYGVGDVEGFVARMRQAAEADAEQYAPELADAYRRAAQRCSQRGDLAQYIAYLEKAVAERPDAADLHYLLGNGHWEAGQEREALRQWRLTLQLQPDHPDRQRMLELIQQAVGASRPPG